MCPILHQEPCIKNRWIFRLFFAHENGNDCRYVRKLCNLKTAMNLKLVFLDSYFMNATAHISYWGFKFVFFNFWPSYLFFSFLFPQKIWVFSFVTLFFTNECSIEEKTNIWMRQMRYWVLDVTSFIPHGYPQSNFLHKKRTEVILNCRTAVIFSFKVNIDTF